MLVHHENGNWAGYSYEWDDNETDGYLVSAAGKEKTISNQLYTYPGRSQCMSCHTASAGQTLGLEISQLNRSNFFPSSGLTGNQLETYEHIGVLDAPLSSEPSQLPVLPPTNDNSIPLNLRARAHFHSNCSQCHRPGETGGGGLDFRFETPDSQVGVINVIPGLGDLGIENALLVAPGEPQRSIVAKRMRDLHDFRMPPIGSNVIDANGIALIEAWISSLDGSINSSPVIEMTKPLNNTVFLATDNVLLEATASDADGSVGKVEFFANGAKLGEDLTAPYSFNWTNAAVGEYLLTAVATDNEAATSTSIAISAVVEALGNIPPIAEMTSPLDGSSFTLSENILLEATASDADGSVSKVEFYANGSKLGEDLTAPYSFDWTNAAFGDYLLTAVATDNEAVTSTSTAISVVVEVLGNIPPTVEMTSPLDGSSFTLGENILLEATASDADGRVSKVEFFAGGAKLGEDLTAPYSFIWTGSVVGNHELTVIATDDSAAIGVSETITISVSGGGGGTQNIVLQEDLDGYSGTQDAYLYEFHHNFDFGALTFLRDRPNIGLQLRSLLRFAIFQSEGGVVPDGATIISATLSLYKYSFYDHVYRLHPLLADWAEDEVTWDERLSGISWFGPGATNLLEDIGNTGIEAEVGWDPQWIDFNVTSSLQAMSEGAANFGWKLEPVSGNGNQKRFYSREYLDDISLRPKLTIEFSN